MTDMQHTARKRFGQNFLCDDIIIGNIVHSIRPCPDDLMIEIGPGLGAMTIPLLESLNRLNVIELDRDIIPRLIENCKRRDSSMADRLIVNEADVLKFDFADFHRQQVELSQDTDKKLRIVGNLPYNISTPILFHLLDVREHIQDMHFMLQKEVVDRICSQPGSKSYGRLSVMVQAYCEAHPLFEVPPTAFRPPPKVDSAIVRLIPVPEGEIRIDDFGEFEVLVRTAFAQRRKTLKNTLRPICDAECIEAAGFSPSRRAEELTVNDFISLYKVIYR